ncbi:tRNA(Ile)-lysidine synthase [Burkholderiales bacterium GJ-E10]|nr:tRNA(Ile)-lysidine synthase [Burkholderiales bacterium GJ-E10]
MARERGAAFVLTAHHADDRLETFLLQWLRGAGPAGLAGIAAVRGAADRDGGLPAVRILRPFLDTARSVLADHVARHALATVDDPSNADTRLARNAIRTEVLPQLAAIRGGYRKSAARSIDLIADAAELMQELGAELLPWCTDGAPADMLRIDRLAALSPARRALALRAWLARAGVEAPSRARLREALAQAIEGAPDGRMRIRFGRQELRRHRGLLCLRVPDGGARGRERLQWRGEPELPVPSWGGVLRFVPTDGGGLDAGFDADWLRARPLDLRSRRGGERLKPHPARPSKHLKHWYQERGVPEFDRAVLPLLWRDDRLIYAAGLGADVRFVESGAGRIRIEWVGAVDLLTGLAGDVVPRLPA